ncbi:hypothetical protein C8N25_102243 [Algoriphagus antarcticus]|uniref:Uncharacterized protein n=1 Tax=Algoriphagus antarcticus TaxID=238540 RepID=A0A3E0E5E7_9BACT|nr:hypothetical protein C8N25_102243 [Algoriphagus antarcticus]
MSVRFVARSGKKLNLDSKSDQIPPFSKGVRACPEYREGFEEANQYYIWQRAGLRILILNYINFGIAPKEPNHS